MCKQIFIMFQPWILKVAIPSARYAMKPNAMRAEISLNEAKIEPVNWWKVH